MHIEISDEFANAGVEVSLGVITYLVPQPIDTAAVERAFLESVECAGTRVSDLRPAELDEIAATRKAFKALGKDPSRYRPSSEALYRRIATGKRLWRVNDVVDANNAISLETKWPVGTYDLERVKAPISLRLGRADEPYTGVGRSDINIEGLTVLADSDGPFGAPFSDSERTKVTQGTRKVLTVLYFFMGPTNAKGICEAAALRLRDMGCAEEIETNWID